MVGLRDVMWSVLLCCALTVVFDCRPGWQAESFVEEEAEAGFLKAYAGHRWAGSDMIIKAKDAAGARDKRTSARVQQRRLVIQARRLNWWGDRVEFAVRHVIHLEDGTPFGEDTSQDIYLRIERNGDGWKYTAFEVRDQGKVQLSGNPFYAALKARAEEDEEG